MHVAVFALYDQYIWTDVSELMNFVSFIVVFITQSPSLVTFLPSHVYFLYCIFVVGIGAKKQRLLAFKGLKRRVLVCSAVTLSVGVAKSVCGVFFWREFSF